MRPPSKLSKGEYLSSINPANTDVLRDLHIWMVRYYLDRRYHDEWVKGGRKNIG